MDATWEAALDLTVLQPPDWSSSVTAFAQQGAAVTLAIVSLVLVVLAFMMLTRPRHGSLTEPGATPGWRLPDGAAANQSWDAQDDSLQRVGLTARSSVSLGQEGVPLTAGGFSAIDVVALTALRKRVESGEVAEGASIPQRLAFARWLAQQGKIAG